LKLLLFDEIISNFYSVRLKSFYIITLASRQIVRSRQQGATTFSIMTLGINGLYVKLSINDPAYQHSTFMLRRRERERDTHRDRDREKEREREEKVGEPDMQREIKKEKQIHINKLKEKENEKHKQKSAETDRHRKSGGRTVVEHSTSDHENEGSNPAAT